MAKVKKSVPKGRKKKWYKIIAPASFRKQDIGETYLYDPKQLLGKTVKVNLMTLTGDPKQQHTNVMFKVKKLDGDVGLAEVIGFQMMHTFLKRIVRRGKNRFDMSFRCRTKDKPVRVKTIVLTRSLTHKPVLTSMRKSAQEQIIRIFKNYTFDKLVGDILSRRIQKQIKDSLKKIYPLKSFEIRYLKEEAPRKSFAKDSEIPQEQEKAQEQEKEEITEEEKEETQPEKPVKEETKEQESKKKGKTKKKPARKSEKSKPDETKKEEKDAEADSEQG